MPMRARRRYQCFNPIQKIAGAQPQFNRSLLPKPVLLRPTSSPYRSLTGKYRMHTISQQPLAASSTLRCDPHAGIHRKTAPRPPPVHFRRIGNATPMHLHILHPDPTLVY